MKLFCLLLAAIAFSLNVPAEAKDPKEAKKDTKKEAKKDPKKDEKKELTYTAIISPGLGDATEGDLTEVKSYLMLATGFKCQGLKLEGKDIVATLSVTTGRLTKSDVAKPLKDSKFKVTKVDDVKPEKEKKDKKDDKKDEPKTGDKPADPKAADPKAAEVKK